MTEASKIMETMKDMKDFHERHSDAEERIAMELGMAESLKEAAAEDIQDLPPHPLPNGKAQHSSTEPSATTKTMKTMKNMQSLLAQRSSVAQALAHTGIYRLHLEAVATLDSTEVQSSVKKPEGVREEEWIAAQVLGILEEVQLAVNLLEDICTEESCPCMTAGKHFTYDWADEWTKQPVELPAPRYMERLIAYATDILSAPAWVPMDGEPFPKNFKSKMSMLVKRFFRVYAHMYLSHFAELRELGLEAHMNMFLKHLMAFSGEFRLMRREDIEPLRELMEKWNLAMPANHPQMVGARTTQQMQN